MKTLNFSKMLHRSLAATTLFAISASSVFAMGGRSGRPGESAELSSLVASSQGMSARAGTPSGNVASVPEIDASSGLLAIAAVLAVVAFMWERNRRQRG